MISIAIKHMLAAGMSHEDIVTAVAEMEAVITPVRSKGAERTARWRERHKASQSVTSDDGDDKKEPVSPRPPSEEKILPPSPPKGGSSPTDEFETWWSEVPRKVSKGQARKAYRTARKAVGADVLISGIRRYAAEVKVRGSPEYTKHPATWLNGECWNDDPMETVNGAKPSENRQTRKSPHDKMLSGFLAAAGDG